MSPKFKVGDLVLHEDDETTWEITNAYYCSDRNENVYDMIDRHSGAIWKGAKESNLRLANPVGKWDEERL